MHKTIGLVVATIASLGAGAAIIWQTEQGWGRILAGPRTMVSEKDLYDAPPVSGNPGTMLASNPVTPPTVTPQATQKTVAPVFADQNEPGEGIVEKTPAVETASNEADPWSAFAKQAEAKTKANTQTPATANGNPVNNKASEDPWSQAFAPNPSVSPSANSQFEPIPKRETKEVASSPAVTDLWGETVAASHEQPAETPSNIQMVEHQQTSESVPAAVADPFMNADSFVNKEIASESPQTKPMPGAFEGGAAMALFPEEPASTPTISGQQEPAGAVAPAAVTPASGVMGLFPGEGAGFPEPAKHSEPAKVSPSSAFPMFPDASDVAERSASTPIRLTQAQDESGPVPAAPPAAPNPIPLNEEPKTESPVTEPTPPAADDFFNFGGTPSPAPAEMPSQVPAPTDPVAPPANPQPAPTPAPLDNPFLFDANPEPTPAPMRPTETSPLPPSSLSPSTLSPAPAATPRPLTDDAMLGTGVITQNVPRVIQRPELSLEKKAPSTAALGEAMVYTIEVKNTGSITAKEVTLEDVIPKGTRLTGTIPQAHMKEKTLIWKLGDMKPGDTQLVKVRVIPLEEGDIGSVATVHFVTEVAAATRITAPVLQLVMEAEPQVAIGEDATIRYKIKNVGEGTAFDVTLYSLIPENFKHPEGTDLEMPIGTLESGQTKEVALVAVAEAAGRGLNEAKVKASGGVTAEARADIEVIDSVLTVERTGPARRFVGHNASYTITVSNQSIRDIEQATIVETVPQGFEFVSATSNGKYNPSTRSVTWNFAKLRSKTQESMQVTLKPDRVGEFSSEVAVVSKDGHKANVAAKTIVEGFASLKIEDPEGRGLVGVGEQISLRFKVRNRGSAPANAVHLSCNVPANIQIVSAKGPTPYRQEGNRLIFEPVTSIAPDQDMQVDFVLVAKTPGNAHLSISVNADEMKDPLNHEENIVVYNPNE